MYILLYSVIYILALILSIGLAVSINVHGFIKGPQVLISITVEYLKSLFR